MALNVGGFFDFGKVVSTEVGDICDGKIVGTLVGFKKEIATVERPQN